MTTSQAPDLKARHARHAGTRKGALDIDDDAIALHARQQGRVTAFGEGSVADGENGGIQAAQLVGANELYTVLVAGVVRVGVGVVDEGDDAKTLELANDVGDARVAQVGDVLLEGEAQHGDTCTADGDVFVDEHLHEFLGNERTHAVVDAPPREDDLRVIAEALGHRCQVVGIDADAVAADQPGLELQEVPLGAGSVEDILGADALLVEDDCQLVHQRNVQIALGVLNDFGRLGHHDGRRAVDASVDDGPIGKGDALKHISVFAADNLGDALKRMLLVARVDALGAVAKKEVDAPLFAAGALDDGAAHLLGDAGVHRGLKHDDDARFAVGDGAADGLAGFDQRAQVRALVPVDGRGHSDNKERPVRQTADVVGDGETGLLQADLAFLAVFVEEATEFLNAARVDVEANGAFDATGESEGHRKTDIAKAYDSDSLVQGGDVRAHDCSIAALTVLITMGGGQAPPMSVP